MSADGTWDVTITSPMGPQKGTLELTSDGDTLTGKLGGPQGELEIRDGAVNGNSVRWKADVTTPMAITLEFDGTLDGDNLSGNVKFGAFGNGSFSGTRT